jgi:predicted nucleotidyltransferase
MRLRENEVITIKRIITQQIPDAQIYLFGSRTDDAKRGGDIDILVIGEDRKSLSDLRTIRILLKEQLGDQRIDLLYQQKNQLTPFAELAKMEGIAL